MIKFFLLNDQLKENIVHFVLNNSLYDLQNYIINFTIMINVNRTAMNNSSSDSYKCKIFPFIFATKRIHLKILNFLHSESKEKMEYIPKR